MTTVSLADLLCSMLQNVIALVAPSISGKISLSVLVSISTGKLSPTSCVTCGVNGTSSLWTKPKQSMVTDFLRCLLIIEARYLRTNQLLLVATLESYIITLLKYAYFSVLSSYLNLSYYSSCLIDRLMILLEFVCK